MSGMTGYDQTTSYPSQYNYVPNLQSPDATALAVGGVDPRQLHGGWGMAANQSHAHYTHMQGSPGHTHHRGYSYYDRNGYYVHQPHGASAAAAGAAASTGNGGGAFDSWHDPTGMRPESPGSGLTAPPSYPSPAAVSSASASACVSGSSSVNYSCKMAVQPPAALSAAGATPPSPTQQKTNDNPQLQSPYGAGAGQTYGQCQLSQNSQPGAAGGPATPYSTTTNPMQPQPGAPPPPVHNSYCGSDGGSATGSGGGGGGAHVGQHSPSQAGGGQNQGGAPQAPLPSPLYPWMRSQFGKTQVFFNTSTKKMKRSWPGLPMSNVFVFLSTSLVRVATS